MTDCKHGEVQVIPGVGVRCGVCRQEARFTLTQPQPDTGLREAAQPFLEAALNVFPEDWISPGSSYAITITVRGSEVDALRAALRSTPAAPQPDACRHCPQDGHTTAWHEAHYTVAPKEDERLRKAAQAVMDAYTDPRDGEFAVSGSGSYGKRQFDALTALRAALRSTPAAPKEDDRE